MGQTSTDYTFAENRYDKTFLMKKTENKNKNIEQQLEEIKSRQKALKKIVEKINNHNKNKKN